jgi:hypothetical protein
MEDRSLDDFFGDESDESTDADGEDTSDETTGSDAVESKTTESDDGESSRSDPEAVEPAASTSGWDGDGGVCADCGERVDRRWRQGEGLVCEACKDW